MFIVWGTKRTKRRLGEVADFCPMCRDVRPFQLLRVGTASHVYFVSCGAGKLTGHIIRCTQCGVTLAAVPSRYAVFEKHFAADLAELERMSFPGLRETYASRLALEAQIQRAPADLTPEQRASLLFEPFDLLHPVVEAYFANGTQLDKQSGIGCFGTILATIAVIAVAIYIKGTITDAFLVATGVVFSIGMIYTFIQHGFAPGRFLRAKILPPLARALAPLKPEEFELDGCLKKCRTLGYKIGKKVKAKQILAEIQLLNTQPH